MVSNAFPGAELMPSDYQLWFKLMIALGIGLLIGAERERRKGQGPSRSAGKSVV